MAINFKGNGFTAEQLINMRTGNQSGEKPTYNKVSWFNAPENLPLFETPKQEVLLKCDILDFRLSTQFHSGLAQTGVWESLGQYYWYYPVTVHECFPHSIVCNKTFDPKRTSNDPVCNYTWEHQEVDFKRVKRAYTVLLLRIHPNEELGITDYKFVVHVDTHGKFASAVMTAWDKAIARKDFAKVDFSKWDEKGMSVEAFFTKLPSKIGQSYWGCNDVTFVKREKQLTTEDINFLDSLDICACIKRPSTEEYADFMGQFKLKAPLKDGYTAPVQAVYQQPVADEIAHTHTVTKAPVVEKPVVVETASDTTFDNPVPIEEDTGAVDTEEWV